VLERHVNAAKRFASPVKSRVRLKQTWRGARRRAGVLALVSSWRSWSSAACVGAPCTMLRRTSASCRATRSWASWTCQSGCL